jgi:hypothetical protein
MGVQTSLAMEPIINNFPAEASLSDVNLPLECDKIGKFCFPKDLKALKGSRRWCLYQP